MSFRAGRDVGVKSAFATSRDRVASSSILDQFLVEFDVWKDELSSTSKVRCFLHGTHPTQNLAHEPSSFPSLLHTESFADHRKVPD